MVDIYGIYLLIIVILVLYLLSLILNVIFALIVSLFKKNKKGFLKIYFKYLGLSLLVIPIIIILIILWYIKLITFGIGISILTIFESLIAYIFAKECCDYNNEFSFIKISPEFYKILGIIFFILGIILLIVSIIYNF